MHEGIVSSIVNFFKKIWRMICKVFGFGNSGGSSGGGGGGASPEQISKCRARMRKLMSRPESEIQKRLESWKQIKIYSPHLFICKLWHTDDQFIEYFMHILGKQCHRIDGKDHEYDQNDSNRILEELFKNFTDYKNDIQMPNDISVSTIRSTYSSYIKSVLPKETTTLYDLVEEQNIDISKLGQDIEIDIKKSMSKIEEDLDSIESYVSGYNEKTWKKIMDLLTKEVEEEAETKPKTAAFKCQMIKEFSQIAIYVCNINRKLCASFLNTLYHALK